MNPRFRDAIDAARDITQTRQFLTQPRRVYSFEHVHYLVLAVLREVPDGMTVAELRDELEIAENQGGVL